jgi:hypothetical protein
MPGGHAATFAAEPELLNQRNRRGVIGVDEGLSAMQAEFPKQKSSVAEAASVAMPWRWRVGPTI